MKIELTDEDDDDDYEEDYRMGIKTEPVDEERLRPYNVAKVPREPNFELLGGVRGDEHVRRSAEQQQQTVLQYQKHYQAERVARRVRVTSILQVGLHILLLLQQQLLFFRRGRGRFAVWL